MPGLLGTKNVASPGANAAVPGAELGTGASCPGLRRVLVPQVCPRALVSVAFPGECARPPLAACEQGALGLNRMQFPEPLPFVIGMASEDRNGLGEAAPRLRALQPLPETSALGSSVLSKVLASAVALGHILGRGQA